MSFRLSLFIMFLCVVLRSEVVFTKQPQSLQLVPRDSDDSATVVINGNAINSNGDTIAFRVRKNSELIFEKKVPIISDSFNFEFSARLHAELSEYFLSVFVDDSLVLQIDSIVCGDAYIVAGQSNALSNATGGAGPVNEWLRTFGRGNNNGSLTVDSALIRSDTVWGRGHAIRSTTDKLFFVGSLGYRFAERIIADKAIPVCIINGAQGDTYINQHLPNSNNPRLLSTIYGRLLYRIEKAGFGNSIKSIIWYQGENDGSTVPATYISRFNSLYQAWKIHYPSFSRIYLFQLRNRKSDIPETQRQIVLQYNDITPLAASSEAELSTDAIHFTVAGYNRLGDWLYGAFFSGYSAPMVRSAEFTNKEYSIVRVGFDQPVYWGKDTTVIINRDTIRASLKDYFSFDTSNFVVDTGWAVPEDSSVYLKLKKPDSIYSTISYLYTRRYHPWSDESAYGSAFATYYYRGHWLTNGENMGAMLFKDYPITTDSSTINEKIAPVLALTPLFTVNNPSSDKFHVSFNANYRPKGKLNIRLINSLGLTVLSHKINDINSGIQFSVSFLPVGVYVFILEPTFVTLFYQI